MDSQIKRGVLLWASFLTLIAAGIGFSVRGTSVLGAWANDFGFTFSELGTITGGGLVGFGVVILLASLITDRVGYKAILVLAGILQIGSFVLTIAAPAVYAASGKDATYWCLYFGMFMFSVSCGLCECVINPLVADLYPKQKTHYLNILHAGWPAGLVLGAVVGLTMGKMAWQIQLATFLVPVVWYLFLVVVNKFPRSQASAAGVSFGTMVLEFASPILLLLLFLHACVGYVELGTDSWIKYVTERIAEGQGTYLFIYASMLMFCLRFVAGPIVEKINPLGLLCLSAAFGATGLFLIGSVKGAVLVWVAVTVYGIGKTFLWPTMLGVVGERFPRGGALTMGAIGGVGMLSAGFLGGPGIGYKQDYYATNKIVEENKEVYDRYKAVNEDGSANLNSFLLFPKVQGLDGAKVGVLLDDAKTLAADVNTLKENKTYDDNKTLKPQWEWWQQTGSKTAEKDKPVVVETRLYGGQMAMKMTALVPLTMFVGYLILVLYFKSRGGYKTVHLEAGGKEIEDGKVSAGKAIEDGEEGPTSGQA